MELDYRPFDADNHYYEPLDAFTRYQDPSTRHRGVEVVSDGKRTYILLAGRVSRFIPNPTFDPVIVPGCTEMWFRGQIPDGVDPKSLMQVEPIHPEYRDRDVRLQVLEQQGLTAALLFPTLGVGVEHGLRHDPEAASWAITAFNRWLEDDWGFAHQNRLFGVPLLSLADPDAAARELDSLLARGARMVHVRPAPVPSATGPRSLGHPAHDPIWARLAEANVPVGFHLGDSGYMSQVAAWGGRAEFEPFGKRDPIEGIIVDDRAIHDTMASMIVHGVFHRHRALRAASIENGSDWIAPLIKRMRKKANQDPSSFPEDPADTLRRHVWVTPYYEDDLARLADTIGVERILFGSDWPHGEGLAEPLQFTKELAGFTPEQTRRIMRDNVLELLGNVTVD